MRGGGAAFEEGDVDEGGHVLGCEGCAFVDELAVFVGIGVEDEFAGVSHDFLGDGLGVAEVDEFGFVLDSAFHYAHIEIAGEFDPGLLDHVGVYQWQGSVRSDAGDVVLYEAFGKGLGGGGFAVA